MRTFRTNPAADGVPNAHRKLATISKCHFLRRKAAKIVTFREKPHARAVTL
jgi:hypothetical protein